MKATEKKKFKTIGQTGPAYEVIKISKQFVTIRLLITGELVKNYPRKDFEQDPEA